MVSGEEPPQRFGVALHAVSAGDDEDRVVEGAQHAFGFSGEVDVTGGVEQGESEAAVFHKRLMGRDGDATRFFERAGVEEGVTVVDAAEFTDFTGAVEQRFGERGLARVHMRHDSRHDSFHCLPSVFGRPGRAG